jgi:hypothetical protein
VKKFFIVFCALLLANTLCFGLAYNDRDPQIVENATTLWGLQQNLNSAVGQNVISATDDQSDVALWTTNNIDATEQWSVNLKNSIWHSGEFGVYSVSETEPTVYAPLITVIDGVGTPTTNTFIISTTGDLTINGDLYENFGTSFGFYWDVGMDGSEISHTEDDMNTFVDVTHPNYQQTNTHPYALALNYLVPDQTTVNYIGGSTLAEGDNDWILAFESNFRMDRNMNDAVFFVQNMVADTPPPPPPPVPVPEPATLFLFSLSFCLLGFINRKRLKK